MANLNSVKDAQKRLDDLVKEAKRDDVSIEQTLDIFDEALKVGSAAIDELNIDELVASISDDEVADEEGAPQPNVDHTHPEKSDASSEDTSE